MQVATTALTLPGAEAAALAVLPRDAIPTPGGGPPAETVLQGELLRGNRRAQRPHVRPTQPPGFVHDAAVARARRSEMPAPDRARSGLDLYRSVASPRADRGRRVDAFA